VATAALFSLFAVAPTVQAQQGGMMDTQADTNGPAAIRYKGVTITPVGYFAGEALFRSRNETSDIGSSFNSIPFGNVTNGRLTEFRGSGRQSRLGLLVQGDPGFAKLTGYFESDFLGVGTSSNSVESNSYALRVRQFWGRAALKNGFTVSFGQMWSLITTDKVGAENRLEDLPPTIDAQYVPGFDWSRQFGVRIAQSLFNKQATIALAAEGAQMTVGGHGAPAQTFIGNPGNSLLNATANYSTDVAPDLLAKIAFDPKGFGHYEIKAIGRVFRDRVVDPACAIGCSKTAIREGGGVGVGAFLPIVPRYVDLTLSGLWGRGIGRYGTSMLPDVVINPQGFVTPVLAAHGMGGLDIHAGPKLDIYLYGGVEYAARTVFQTKAATPTAQATFIGYGQPTVNNNACDTEVPNTGGEFVPGAPTCSADTKALYQGTAGFWYRFYRGKAGTFQWGLQYSYTSRNTWSALGGYAPQAIENMAFTSFRYYVP
jgi:hypothetical protein